MTTGRLDENKLEQALAALNATTALPWRLESGKLCKEFIFADFAAAFAFMNLVAIEAEDMDHHPEWCNVYNKVSVRLLTHEAGGITGKDFALARKMEAASAG